MSRPQGGQEDCEHLGPSLKPGWAGGHPCRLGQQVLPRPTSAHFPIQGFPTGPTGPRAPPVPPIPRRWPVLDTQGHLGLAGTCVYLSVITSHAEGADCPPQVSDTGPREVSSSQGSGAQGRWSRRQRVDRGGEPGAPQSLWVFLGPQDSRAPGSLGFVPKPSAQPPAPALSAWG